MAFYINVVTISSMFSAYAATVSFFLSEAVEEVFHLSFLDMVVCFEDVMLPYNVDDVFPHPFFYLFSKVFFFKSFLGFSF